MFESTRLAYVRKLLTQEKMKDTVTLIDKNLVKYLLAGFDYKTKLVTFSLFAHNPVAFIYIRESKLNNHEMFEIACQKNLSIELSDVINMIRLMESYLEYVEKGKLKFYEIKRMVDEAYKWLTFKSIEDTLMCPQCMLNNFCNRKYNNKERSIILDETCPLFVPDYLDN